MEMASTSRFSYQRLKQEILFDGYEERERFMLRSRSWCRLRRVHIKKRFRFKVPSLRRFLRRKIRLVSASWAKVLKRLKEGQGHVGDLFAGNYLFLQVNPSSLKSFDKSYNHVTGLKINYELPPRFTLPGTA